MKKTCCTLLVCLLLGMVISCNSSSEKKQAITVSQEDINQSLNTNFDGKIFSIPSPILTMLLLKKVSSDFQVDYLNSTSRVDAYQTEHQRALLVGVYGADLGYASMYKEKNTIVDYLLTVEKLSNSLGLESSFDKQFIERYQKNTDNSDSMMHIVSDAFKNADLFLKNGDRKSVSALVLAGGWTESMYFATNLALKHKNKELLERIAEQKQTLETLISLLEVNNKQNQNDALIGYFKPLLELFQSIQTEYTYNAPITDEQSKTTTLTHTVSYDMPEETFKEIQKSITEIRTFIIE